MTCTFPNCECQHPPEKCFFKPENQVTSERINSTEFPRLKRLMNDPAFRDERLAELEGKLAGEYVGGMTEYWKRQRDFLLTQKGQEIMDVLDGPDQECYPLCEDEGCPHFGTPHVCINLDKPID